MYVGVLGMYLSKYYNQKLRLTNEKLLGTTY